MRLGRLHGLIGNINGSRTLLSSAYCPLKPCHRPCDSLPKSDLGLEAKQVLGTAGVQAAPGLAVGLVRVPECLASVSRSVGDQPGEVSN